MSRAGAVNAAPSDPFVRGAPAQTLPGLKPLPQPAPTSDRSAVPGGAGASALPPLGAPRVSSSGSQTKVVFDLPPGVGYVLTPGFGGMQLELSGVRAAPSVTGRLGMNVGEYRVVPVAGGAQLSLGTAFSLGLSAGWRASEATIASGGRVLILEFGPALQGGAAPSVRGTVRADQAVNPGRLVLTPPSLEAPKAPDAAVPASPAPATAGVSAPGLPGLSRALPAAAAPTSGPGSADQVPPGDAAGNAGGSLPAPAAGLPGAQDSDPNVLRGKAQGAVQAGALLGAPRIGKNPGVTRVVLDLPPGSSFSITPGALGLSIDLSGAGADEQMSGAVSSELLGWRYSSAGDHSNVTLLSASALTERSGWHSVLLPPVSGSDRSRLAIDLSPAFANTTPLLPVERVLAAVPPVRSAALGFAGNVLVRPSVVIDAGHGGRDPGAVGLVTEKAVVLDVALRVRSYLQAAGVDVIMSRDSDRELFLDKTTDLNARAALGYKGAQLFVSIHANSMEPVNVLRGYGIETWWNNNNPGSPLLAGALQSSVIQVTGAYDQGLKSSRSLAVLRGSKIPAALVEIGFVGHPVDGGNLQDNNYLERVALGIARGIRQALVSNIAAH
ncbi:N-acetylmuramoyl-L-alanine amidase [Deinococcus irradiatisoli]|uniref:N-acetylmuramoyl-L-alanine amidase family protein n=1 Tax=Deinococcus irradiatisoli TaxID=2202254 RepID=UPI00319EA443